MRLSDYYDVPQYNLICNSQSSDKRAVLEQLNTLYRANAQAKILLMNFLSYVNRCSIIFILFLSSVLYRNHLEYRLGATVNIPFAPNPIYFSRHKKFLELNLKQQLVLGSRSFVREEWNSLYCLETSSEINNSSDSLTVIVLQFNNKVELSLLNTLWLVFFVLQSRTKKTESIGTSDAGDSLQKCG